MPKNRIDRINEEILHCIAELLPTVKDPRVRDAGMISVTHVDTARDLSYAKVYLSVFPLNGKPVVPKELTQGLNSSAPFLRRELGRKVTLRISPELHFIIDDSLDRGAHIIQVIEETRRKEEEQ